MVSPFGQLSTFQKDLSPAAGKKRSRRRESAFLPGADDGSFTSRDLSFTDKTQPPSDTFFGESREPSCVYGWCFVGYGEGAVLPPPPPSPPPFSL